MTDAPKQALPAQPIPSSADCTPALLSGARDDIALYLVATPIGDDSDLSPRAIRLLLEAKFIIGEEFRPLTTLLKRIGRPRTMTSPRANQTELSDLEVLNEHSTHDEIKTLADRVIAVHKTGGFTALMSDCGTPGFCDPGAALVAELRKRGFACSAAPGASALMCLLSLAGIRLDQFIFRGFLPASREERGSAVKEVVREKRHVIVMDTPYRLEKLLTELATAMPTRTATLGCDFTSPRELTLQGTLSEIAKKWSKRPPEMRKAEFMILLHGTENV